MDRLALKRKLFAERDSLAEAIMARHYKLDPSLEARYDDYMKARCVEDVRYHLTFLAEAVATGTPAIFVDYIQWAKTVLVSRNVNIPEVEYNLHVLKDALAEQLDGEAKDEVAAILNVAIQALAASPRHPETAPPQELAERYIALLLKNDRRGARDFIIGLADHGTPLQDIYLSILQASQREVGRLWHENKISVAHEHFCTAVTQGIMAELYRYFSNTPRKNLRLVAAAVPGEIHEMGIRMVADFFEMDGWDTYFVGANTPIRDLMRLIEEQRPHVLAISASTALNLTSVNNVIAAVKELGEQPRLMVGGRVFLQNPNLWQTVGADGYAHDAKAAVLVAHSLLGA